MTISPQSAATGPVHTWVQERVVSVDVSHRTALLLGRRGLGSLHAGSELFVAGRAAASGFNAVLLADPREMQEPRTKAPSATATAASQGARPLAAPYRLASATVPAPTNVPSSSGFTSATATSATPNSVNGVSSGENPDTVELHDKTGVLGKLPAFSFDPHADATVGIGDNCNLGFHAGLVVANDFELHWPFQFVREGAGFGVVALDRPQPPTFSAGPLRVDVGVTDPSNYTVYSGFGISGHLSASIECHLFGPVSINAGIGFGDIGFASINKTLHHARLSGDPNGDLEVPPDQCGGASINLGPVTAGVQDCQYQTLGAGLLRATLTGQGGTHQGIAVSYQHGDVVHYQTAPNGGPIRVDEFNYAAALKTKMVLGLLVNINAKQFLPFKKRTRITAAQQRAGVFTSAQRRPNQRGPTLPNGRWRNNHNTWHDSSGKQVAAPSDAEIATASTNWIHENQVGPTYSNGVWRDRELGQWLDPFGFKYQWRDAQGKVLPGPPSDAKPNQLTATDPTEQEPVAYTDGVQGWTYDTEEGGAITPAHVDPPYLLLNLPIEAAPPPRPPKPPLPIAVSCSIPGGAEGGAAPLAYNTKGLSCAEGKAIVQGAVAPPQSFQGFDCRTVRPGPPGPGSQITCKRGTQEVTWKLAG